MHLYKTARGNILKYNDQSFLLAEDWDTLINRKDLYGYLKSMAGNARVINEEECNDYVTNYLLPPIGNQEVWAAGVTYLRSRDARMEESEDAGSADCYQKVYEAERPELFFKSLPHRVSGHNQPVNIRKDSSWNVPEPELALYMNSYGEIQAYTVGNDMSSRSIEGENPLYLPQAKVYEKSAGIGPCLFISNEPVSLDTTIHMNIYRDGKKMFDDATTVRQMKRSLTDLAAYLFLELDFVHGCFLLTGTCVVPPSDFTLQDKDIVNITIDNIGTLTNTISIKK
jgi:2-dehydro-3-deoxy-D-arabinonate dehydratase